MKRAQGNGLVMDLAAGAAVGLAATWVMGRVTTFMYERQDRYARRREDRVRGGRTSYERAAEKAADAIGIRLSRDERRLVGSAIHWTIGIAAGTMYGALRKRIQRAAAARGLAFGATFWLLLDEMLVPAMRLTPGPRAFPWQTHARGLVGHLAYAAAADAMLRIVRRT
jgi:hypothetical protein